MHQLRTFLFLSFTLLALTTVASGQTTIHVPADQPTIQAGINAAQNGDTVLVAPGVYAENIDFMGKGIVVTSGATTSAEAVATIIQAPNQTPAVVIQSGEPSTTVLNGFTIAHTTINGQANLGDGISIAYASPSITNNILSGINGCSLQAYEAPSLLVEGNTITGQQYPANYSCGTAKYEIDEHGEGTLNVSFSGSVSLIGNVVTGNGSSSVAIFGPGITVGNTNSVMILNNVIENNLGGGDQLYITVVPKIAIIQNLIANQANGGGLGILNGNNNVDPFLTTSVVIVNNTVYAPYGSGIEATATSSNISNNIFLSLGKNQGFSWEPFTFSEEPSNATLICSHNDVYSTQITPGYTCAPPANTIGNISSDPQFIDATNNNFHVNPSSPVVAAGDITAPLIPPADLDGKAREVCGTIDMGVYEVRPHPPIALTGTPNPVAGGNNVTFAAKVQGNCNVPTGTVAFLDGATVLTTQTLDANGNASFSTSALTVGSHNITVTYPGDFNFENSVSNTVVEIVTGDSSTAVLTASPTTAIYGGTPITLTATISPATPPGIGTPAGTVTFIVDGASGASEILTNGTATLNLTDLSVGTHLFGCSYSGDTNYSSSVCNSASATITAAPTALTVTSSMNPAPALTPVTFTLLLTNNGVPVGAGYTVDFISTNGVSPPIVPLTTNASGMATYSVTSPAIGSYPVGATFAGTSNLAASSANGLTEVITAIPTTTTLSASPNPGYQGQPVTITASVTSSVTTPPTGTVIFFDNGNQINSLPVNSSGVATFTTSTLALGTHTLTANFGSNFSTVFAPSHSNTVNEVIAQSSFTLTLSPTTITIPAGKQGSATLLLKSVGNFSGPLTLSFGLLPQYATASISSSTVTLTSGSDASAAFTLQTSALAANTVPPRPGSRTVPITLCTLLVLLPLALRKRNRLRSVLMLCATAVLLQALTGCTMIRIPFHLVAVGSYQVPVTAMDANNNTQTQTLTVVVTP